MISYRVYLLDGAGDILSAREFEAGNDEQARLKARGFLTARHAPADAPAAGIEVWDGRRLVFSSNPRLRG